MLTAKNLVTSGLGIFLLTGIMASCGQQNFNSSHSADAGSEPSNKDNYYAIAMMNTGEAISLRFVTKDEMGRQRCLTNKSLESFAKPENFVAWDDCITNVADSKYALQVWWTEKRDNKTDPLNTHVIYNIDAKNGKRHYLRTLSREISGAKVVGLTLTSVATKNAEIAKVVADKSSHFAMFDYYSGSQPPVYVVQQFGYSPTKPFCAAKNLETMQLNDIDTDYKVEYLSAAENCANIRFQILYAL